MLRPVALILSVISATSAFAIAPLDTSNQVIISVRDQKLVLHAQRQQSGDLSNINVNVRLGRRVGTNDHSSRLFGGRKKIGDNVPVGAVFHKRRLTGEVLQPNAPGRDPITTRIIWLRGLEAQNAHAFQRCIYIHGTPEEKKIGQPASYGCIRMKSKDVAELYDQLPLGAVVQIIPDRLPKMEKTKPRQEMSGGVVAANITPQPPPQITATKVAKVTPQAPPQIAATTVAKVTPQAPPQITATKAANVTPQPPPQISATTLAMPPSSSLTVEQMRTAGALAGARQKAKLAANKRL